MGVREFFEEAKEKVIDFVGRLTKDKNNPVPSMAPIANTESSKGLSLGDDLLRQGMLGGDEAARGLAVQFGMLIIEEITSLRMPKETYKKVPYSFVKRHLVLPLYQEADSVIVAVSDPLDLGPLDDLRIMLGGAIKAAWAPKEAIINAINDCYNKEHGAASQLIADMTEGQEESDGDFEGEVYDLLDDSQGQAPIIKLLNLILSEAIQQGASDIHFDPLEDGLQVRYRIDGVLHDRHAPAAEYQSQLLTRVKVMAKMDIAERRLPQDGRIKLRMGKREIDFRVSTVPVVYGERIVMRILDKGNVALGLDKLGMPALMLEEFKKLLGTPEGIVLVTGPTGSGKTTTLYSAICDMTSEELNIMTVEDPVEYNLKGIAQIGVRPNINLTFASGLRHILRQDPDVIMIGEIRDKETAEIAIQSALTGHLVLSTLHTNDAPAAITRLVDMGIESYLLSSTIVGVLAQRLVRKICPFCKEKIVPNPADLKVLNISPEMLPEGCIYEGKGCESCYGYGYLGRHGIYELMTVGHALHQQIVRSPDAIEMRKIAVENGMMTLREHGAYLVAAGVTTVAEVLRVVRGTDEVGSV